MALLSTVGLEFRNVGFCGGRKAGVTGGEPSEQGAGAQTENRTRATLVGGECYHQCSILAWEQATGAR